MQRRQFLKNRKVGEDIINNKILYSNFEYNIIRLDNDNFNANITLNTRDGNKNIIVFDNSVTSIGDNAFYDCNNLISITLPESVTEIRSGAFKDCSSLIKINIPEGVTSIGDDVFSGCSNLSSINIPENSQLTSIGSNAFKLCRSLENITIPKSVKSIGDYAFNNCSGLTEIHIASIESWLTINYSNELSRPNYAASNVKLYINGEELTELEVPSILTSIPRYAFRNCGITSVIIPESVTNIGEMAFFGCSRINSITVAEGNAIYDSRNGCNAIIETNSNTLMLGCSTTTIPESVTSIGNSAFSGCESLTTITIPESVTSIGDHAFYECSKLTTITIPESVTSIGEWAFTRCSSLTTITIPEGVTSIGNRAFNGCTNLYKIFNNSSLSLSKGSSNYGEVAYYAQVVYQGGELTTIGDFQFYTSDGIHSLANYVGNDTEIILPDSYNGENYKIGNAAFSNCSSLTSINIPERVTSIGEHAFEYCTSLSAINIPEGVTSIGDYAFYHCTNLTSTIIPENSQLKSIGERAFADCYKLSSIIIPADVMSIESGAFSGTPWYSNKPNGLIYINNVLYDYKGTMPTNTSIEVREGTISINDYAFKNCRNLISINIPLSMTSIGKETFRNCSSITAITCEAITPPAIGNSYTFYNVNKSIPIYVPAESVDAYKAANVWKNFTNIQAL